LYQPDQKSDKLTIIVGGSGPTDRDGNQMMLQCDTYKKLASFLAIHGIAVFTYDKRILRINELAMSESDLRFDDFVDDLISAVEYFEKHHSFKQTILLGHSQGSLVSLVALQDVGDNVTSSVPTFTVGMYRDALC
jgi:alpha-beta hydrolase superfamily lysophospholipase